MSFKKGDKVICKDDKMGLGLKSGQVYTIKEVVENSLKDRHYLIVNGLPTHYLARRFELANSEIIKKRLRIT